MFETALKLNFIIVCVVLQHTLTERCVTPNGARGECVNLASCPALLRSFTNPRRGTENYLKQFICNDTQQSGFIVCCHADSNALLFETSATNAEKIAASLNLDSLKNCGLKYEGNDLINEGIISTFEFPWIVSVRLVTQASGESEKVSTIACTGSLISARYVLTSGRCATVAKTWTFTSVIQIQEFHINNETNCTEISLDVNGCDKYREYAIENYIIHPFYDQTIALNDIALLKLKRLVSLSTYIRLLCLPTPKIKITQLRGSLRTSVWNDTAVKESLISNGECNLLLSTRNVSVSEYDMCTIMLTTSKCNEYTGSPVMISHDNRWYMEGVTSRCFDYTNTTLMVHTKVTNYLQWIQENVEYDQCTNPNGVPGECKYLSDCPELEKAFADGMETIEDSPELFCYEVRDWNWHDPVVVCCGTASNFTVSNDTTVTQAPITKANKQPVVPISDYCGFQRRDDYFSNYTNVTTDEYPWTATIYNKLPDDYEIVKEYRYSGALINSKYVLTAASFLVKHNIVPIERIVRLGVYEITNGKDCNQLPEYDSPDCSKAEEYGVEEEIVHPLYTIALLRLNKSVIYSDTIRPICLPPPDASFINPGDFLYISGWDYQSYSKSFTMKQKISSTLISEERCGYLNLNKFVPQSQFRIFELCSVGINESRFTCNVDVGAPVMVSKRKNQWFIVGVATEYTCGRLPTQIHDRVSTYLNWINRNMLP